MDRNSVRVLLTVILLGVALLRIPLVVQRSIWLDEAFSWTLVSKYSVVEMVTRTANDTHPPLYYLLLKFWVGILGDSLIAMRSFSVAGALLTCIGLFLLCRDSLRQSNDESAANSDDGVAIGLLAATLMCLSSTHAQWSSEARMYSLGTALAVWSSWCLVRSLSVVARPHRDASTNWRWWTAYTLTATALLYTHHYGLFTVFAQGCFAVGAIVVQRRMKLVGVAENPSWISSSWLATIMSFGAVLLLYAPWVPILMKQKSRVQADFWIPLLNVWSVPDAWSDLLFPTNFDATQLNHFYSILVINVVMIVWLNYALRCQTLGEWLIACMGLVPVMCAVGVSIWSVSVISSRHFLFVLPFFMIAVARVVWSIPCRVRPLIVGALIVNLAGFHLYYLSRLDLRESPGLNGVADVISADFQAGDQIVVQHPAVLYCMRYYAARRDWTPPALLKSPSESGAETIQHFLGSAIIDHSDFTTLEQIGQQKRSRIWIIDTTGFTQPDRRPHRQQLHRDWRPISEQHFREVYYFQGSVSVALYEPRSK